MATAIYSLANVHGAELWLLFWFLCMIAYVGGCLLVQANRSRQGVKNMLVGLLAAEVAVDLIWALIYYDHAVYINYGIGAVYGIFIWIPVLLLAAAIITVINRRKVR